MAEGQKGGVFYTPTSIVRLIVEIIEPFHGRIFDPADLSPDTEGVREFTRRITTSARWTTSLVPLRDGMIIALKR